MSEKGPHPAWTKGADLRRVWCSRHKRCFQIQTEPISQADVTGDVILRLSFDDATDQYRVSYSLDPDAAAPVFLPVGSPVAVDMTNSAFSAWMLEGTSMDKHTRCKDFFDHDGDTDGRDLFLYTQDDKGIPLAEMAQLFGQTGCIQ